MSEIKACPFQPCEGPTFAMGNCLGNYWCSCTKCHARSPVQKSPAAAIAAWNGLCERLAKVAELEALVKRAYPHYPEPSGLCSCHQHGGPVECEVCWPNLPKRIEAHVSVKAELEAGAAAIKAEYIRLKECADGRMRSCGQDGFQIQLEHDASLLRPFAESTAGADLLKRLAAADKLAEVAYKSGVLVSTGELEAALAAYREADVSVYDMLDPKGNQ